MKISKRAAVKANEEIIAEIPEEVVVVSEETAEDVPVVCPYQEAIDCIHCAIEALGAVAKEDPLARESIANLSVVLFDLKN